MQWRITIKKGAGRGKLQKGEAIEEWDKTCGKVIELPGGDGAAVDGQIVV